ncbi:2-hydroxy-3-keto-5-methylthiopentenyl-1-phosphate phosphatase [Paenibacillus baekrokdamisoli]|uniref:2-hydroxy-3-keto-5-methylthiopentenyl-1-phosphate phosphatase n=1 Tax=Paenibacillus baekrokdamisoli TaxID=1712516 RepID=A0A3G9J4K5_9BACL|nr:2-hydroxy-3-keto-5-methylthiopentenyl-1-phosphate phosphatase [Paenibacillus baekrokdamisoli]MBB3067145.1 2-hydroxy-3-keto-5-methylthiopentenyl-1-phosphate phosphatase [Paenibacillus baekrokdamisoli]BBH19663.1 2-hydroxy-3-keto-5-methylthiopentenyl-1-phosphate phosphatase [Paenibacillus baekrokdamisoli]
MTEQSQTTSNTEKKRVIFCDFDGTITENDNIIAIIRHFNPPGWETIVNDIVGQRKSIRQGVGELFQLLPSSKKQEVIEYAIKNARIRAGFTDLLDYCAKNDVEFYVTSGGIDFFVYPLLAPFDIELDHIYCNGSDFTSEQIEITWPHACEGDCTNECGMCKTSIIRRFPADTYTRILIGDSVTDFEGAKIADIVFARSHLTLKCKELGLAYYEFETFHDVLDVMKQQEEAGN